MTIPYNQYNLEAEFKNYLTAENIQPVSLKNYSSDLRHFLGWLTALGEASPQNITEERLSEYFLNLADNQTPIRTINRRLSTIRKFCKFCLIQNWITLDPSLGLQNHLSLKIVTIGHMLKEYRGYLQNTRLSASLIDEKIADVKNLLQI